jgi:HEAT repeat protein
MPMVGISTLFHFCSLEDTPRRSTPWSFRTLVFLIAATVPLTALGQTRANPDGPTLSAGWAALESGRVDDAATTARRLLQLSPSSHAALLLYLSALGQGPDPAIALDAYDEWQSRHQPGDPHLLRVIGEGVLRRLASEGTEVAVRVAAAEELYRLKALGATEALDALSRRGTDTAVVAARARAGDQAAAQTLLKTADGLAGSAKADVVRALSRSGVAASAALERFASDGDEMVRIAAIEGLRTSDDPDTIALLNRLLTDPVPFVRQAAAVALVSRGDPAGEAIVTAMLASGIPDVVLTAAEALPGQPERWRVAVEGTLQAEDPIDRLRAARLLVPMRSAEAEAEITSSLAHENPAIREEAARAAATARLTPASQTLRDMLRDRSEWVRLSAARILVGGAAPLQ